MTSNEPKAAAVTLYLTIHDPQAAIAAALKRHAAQRAKDVATSSPYSDLATALLYLYAPSEEPPGCELIDCDCDVTTIE